MRIELRELELELELELRGRGKGGYECLPRCSRLESDVCKCGRVVTEAWTPPRYVPTVLECPRRPVTLAMATTTRRWLQQVVTVSCCTIYLEDLRVSGFGGGFEVGLYATKV